MGHRELIDSLRKDGEATINAIWNEAKAEEEKIRAGTDRRIEEAGNNYRAKLDIEKGEIEQSILSGAKKRVRAVRLSAEASLSERLYNIASGMLPEMKKSDYEDTFGRLAGELPDAEWTDIRVHQDDMETAKKHFPHAHIAADEDISGGLEACREEGKICITNTFEKRLERAWDMILPLLINELYREATGNEPSDQS